LFSACLLSNSITGYPKWISKNQLRILIWIPDLLPEYHVVDIHPGYLICCLDIQLDTSSSFCIRVLETDPASAPSPDSSGLLLCSDSPTET
jgi:hypothetical protein